MIGRWHIATDLIRVDYVRFWGELPSGEMRIHLNTSLAIAYLGLAVFGAVSGTAQAQSTPRRIALKSGESTELRNFYAVQHCRSILIGTPVLDVLEGAEDLTVTFKEGTKVPKKCTISVPGGTVIAAAKDIKTPKEAKLTIRLKFKTKIGERQTSNSYIVSLFP